MKESEALSPVYGRVFELLDKIEYRRITSNEDFEDVGRLRARAYRAANIMPVKGDMLIDDLDFDDHAYVFGIYYDENLVSTVRIHHVTQAHSISSSGQVYQRHIDEFLDAGMSLIDPTRLAADLSLIRDLPGLNFLTMRIATMASDFFDVDRCLSLIKPQHAAFYRRMFDFHTVVPPREKVGKYTIPLTLMASNIRAARAWIYERYPFLQAHHYEMRMMFGALEDMPATPLTVLPTARYAAARAQKEAPGRLVRRARA